MKKKILIFSGLYALIDQIVKIFIFYNVSGTGIKIIDNFLYINQVENTGAAWGILSGSRWFLIIISILALYAIIKYFLLDVSITKIEIVAYILLIGGIFGNLIDRFIYGFVIDYISFRFGAYQFPVFNIADIGIVMGTILLIYHLMRNAVLQGSKK